MDFQVNILQSCYLYLGNNYSIDYNIDYHITETSFVSVLTLHSPSFSKVTTVPLSFTID